MRGTAMRQRDNVRIRRVTKAFAAAGLALALAGACTAGTAMVGAQPSGPSVPFGSTASPMTTSASGGNCNVYASSVSPTTPVPNQSDINAIKARGKLVVGVAADQYLTGYLGANSVEQGFDIDLAHAIAQSLFGDPNKVKFVALSTDKRIPDLQNKSVDLVIDTMTITCLRLTEVDFSAVYYNASQKLLVEKGSGYKSLAGLGGKNVCAQTGSTSIQLIQQAASTPKPNAIEVTDITDCLVLLQENKVAAISTDDTILAGLAAQDPNLEVVGTSLSPEPYGIAMRLGATDLEAYVNGVLAQYEADGGWAASYNHWFGSVPGFGAASPPRAQYSD